MTVVADLVSAPTMNTSSVLERAGAKPKLTTTSQCLVVSLSQQRREKLVCSANDAGWETVACADTSHAWRAVQRERFELALIDLDGMQGAVDGLKELTEHVVSNQRTLLVVCGNEGNAMEEIWARQLGAWLYLPGVTLSSDVRSLCEEAMAAVGKLTGKALV